MYIYRGVDRITEDLKFHKRENVLLWSGIRFRIGTAVNDPREEEEEREEGQPLVHASVITAQSKNRTHNPQGSGTLAANLL